MQKRQIFIMIGGIILGLFSMTYGNLASWDGNEIRYVGSTILLPTEYNQLITNRDSEIATNKWDTVLLDNGTIAVTYDLISKHNYPFLTRATEANFFLPRSNVSTSYTLFHSGIPNPIYGILSIIIMFCTLMLFFSLSDRQGVRVNSNG